MSRCAHGVFSAKVFRNAAAVHAPPSRPPLFLMQRDFAADLLLVFREERHRPEALAASLRGGEQRVAQRVIAAPEARGIFAERDAARAGERGDIDDRGGAVDRLRA